MGTGRVKERDFQFHHEENNSKSSGVQSVMNALRSTGDTTVLDPFPSCSRADDLVEITEL